MCFHKAALLRYILGATQATPVKNGRWDLSSKDKDPESVSEEEAVCSMAKMWAPTSNSLQAKFPGLNMGGASRDEKEFKSSDSHPESTTSPLSSLLHMS